MKPKTGDGYPIAIGDQVWLMKEGPLPTQVTVTGFLQDGKVITYLGMERDPDIVGHGTYSVFHTKEAMGSWWKKTIEEYARNCTPTKSMLEENNDF